MPHTDGMTIAELEEFIGNVKAAGGDGSTVIKVVTSTGAVKDIKQALVWHVIGHPVLQTK